MLFETVVCLIVQVALHEEQDQRGFVKKGEWIYYYFNVPPNAPRSARITVQPVAITSSSDGSGAGSTPGGDLALFVRRSGRPDEVHAGLGRGGFHKAFPPYI